MRSRDSKIAIRLEIYTWSLSHSKYSHVAAYYTYILDIFMPNIFIYICIYIFYILYIIYTYVVTRLANIEK